MSSIEIQAPAKLNLYLHVTGRREDGYHLVDTLIAFCDFGDRLTVSPSDTISLTASGPFADDLPAPEENLIFRALQKMQAAARDSGRIDGASISLEKSIPLASGVGGGSTDAAAAMLAVNKLWAARGGTLFSDQELDDIARELGSDMPVSLYRRPAFASGVGHELIAGPILPKAGVLLVNPGVKLSTPSVFGAREGGFTPDTADPAVSIPSVSALAAYLADRENDLMEAALRLCPAIEDVLAAIAATPGCLMSRMSGSGATCFGLFETRADAEEAARHIDSPYWWVQPTELSIPAPI